MEQGTLLFVLPVEWKNEGPHCGVPEEKNRDNFSVGYWLIVTRRFSFWDVGRLRQGVLRCGVLAEWNREVFSV